MCVHGEQLVWQAPHTHRVKAGTTRHGGKKGVYYRIGKKALGAAKEERGSHQSQNQALTLLIFGIQICKLSVMLEMEGIACQ